MKLLEKIPFRFWIIICACFIVFSLSCFRTFNDYELLSYDLRLRLRPPLKSSPDIVIIEISDDTLKNLRTWPLPRDFHASLIDVLKQLGAKAVVFDIIFDEPTLYDQTLAQSLKAAGNVYLPFAFYIQDRLRNEKPFPESNKILGGISNTLEPYVHGKGHINVLVDADGKIRRIPLFIQYQNKFIPHLGLKAACDWLGLDSNDVEIQNDKVIVGHRLLLPYMPPSYFLVNYPDKWERSFEHLSYFEILKAYNDIQKGLKPKIDLNILKNKACFIGLTATGTSDLRAIPLQNIYPMLGLQASVFNSIVSGNCIRDAGTLLNTLINLIVFLISLIICLKLRPLRAFLASIAAGAVYFLVALVSFIAYGIWIDLFLPLLIIGSAYAGVTVFRFLDEARKRQILEKELDIARAIQKSFLPQDLRDFHGVNIFSFMEPAKFVGGDLYDILPLNDKKAALLIGDVSGKGVPAALIMAQTISFFRIFSHQYPNCREVLNRLNLELCGKFEGRFVTCIYMIIDAETRKVRAASAAHAPLLVYKKNQNAVLEVALSTEIPLGIMEDAQYQEVEFEIEKGDMVIIFTDGLSEARNKKSQEFGIDNIKQIILKNSSSPQKVVESMKEKVLKFSAPLPQHDDITLLLISYQ